jgi:UV DNA damage endonuclease
MRVGAACVWVNPDYTVDRKFNQRSATVAYVSGLRPRERHEYLHDIAMHNTRTLRFQLQELARLPKPLRMWRIASGLLPLKTHKVSDSYYRDSDAHSLIGERLAWCGRFAREHGIRLSFHPGQYVVLGSRTPAVRAASVMEMEYHGEIYHRMEYRGWHQDGFAINVHVGLKDPDIPLLRKTIRGLDSSVRNTMTLENDEFSWSTERIVHHFGDLVPVVLDVHHHWIHEGRRLKPTDPLVDAIRATWRGVQPKLHLAMSNPELTGAGPRDRLSLNPLLRNGQTKSSLRAHSLHPWHTRSIDYAARFGYDIMWEGKDKNVGVMQIAEHLGMKTI